MTIKMLVVDDEPHLQPLIRQIFRQPIRQQEYEMLFALNGQEALQQLRADQDIEIVVTDINMPNVDGLTLLASLPEIKSESDRVIIPVVFSAYGDMANIRRAMNEGAFDFLTKPIDPQDLRLTIRKTVEHLQQLKRATQQEERAKTALHRINEMLERRVEERTAALKAANEALKISNAELDTFAHTVAHDLKNPLGVIVSYSDLLLGTGSDLTQEELAEVYETLYQTGQRAIGIVDELLLLAKVRKSNVEIMPVDMEAIVHRALMTLTLKIEEYKVDLKLPEQWPKVLGHAPWIEEVWVNYLSNGIKYGGRPPRLELGITPGPENMVCFWVKDNGAGLSAEAQSVLFTEFTRLDRAKIEGYGLGLSIVRRIIEKLGGEVGVESAPNQGSKFYFTLKRAGQG